MIISYYMVKYKKYDIDYKNDMVDVGELDFEKDFEKIRELVYKDKKKKKYTASWELTKFKPKDRPDVLAEEHLEYLDELLASGETNMFGVMPYLIEEYPELSKSDAQAIIDYWRETFSARHNDNDNFVDVNEIEFD